MTTTTDKGLEIGSESNMQLHEIALMLFFLPVIVPLLFLLLIIVMINYYQLRGQVWLVGLE